MKVLVVSAHPRSGSLTASLTKRFIEGLSAAGHEHELVDLYAEEFNPLLFPEDEPDWENPSKIYSDVVMQEQKRIAEHDALVYTFPVWWYSLPAILKGYIDRVWEPRVCIRTLKAPGPEGAVACRRWFHGATVPEAGLRQDDGTSSQYRPRRLLRSPRFKRALRV